MLLFLLIKQFNAAVLLKFIYYTQCIYYAPSYDDFSIRVYQLFTEIFHKCINIAVNVLYILPIMLALYLMFSMTHYAQNYAGIVGGSLHIIHFTLLHEWNCENS